MKKIDLATAPIAVLGGGGSGVTHAVECALDGREVRLFEFPEFLNETRAIGRTNRILLSGSETNANGYRHNGTGEIGLITSDLAQAVWGAGILIISLPALGIERICTELVPLLEEGQVVHFMTGNFGTLVLRKKMREAGCETRILMGDWCSQPFGTHIVFYAGRELPEVDVMYRAITLRGAALPSSDNEAWMETVKYIPSMRSVVEAVPADSVIDVSFSNINPLMHPAASILSVSMMENWTGLLHRTAGEYSIYAHGFCRSIGEVQYGVYREQKAIVEALGLTLHDLKKEQFESRSGVLAPEYMGECNPVPFEVEWTHQMGAGPGHIRHRFITEDVPVGLGAQKAFAEALGVATPIIDSIFVLASVMAGQDFLADRWNLETLGLAGMSKEEIVRLMHTPAHPL